MFEYYNNILCVQGGWLFDSGVLTFSMYKTLTSRKHLIIERKGGNGRTALIQYDTMRTDIKEKVVAITGNPYDIHKNHAFINSILRDQEAITFFDLFTYTKNNEDHSLPNETRTQYVVEASILNAVAKWVHCRQGELKIMGGSTKNVWGKVAEIVASLPNKDFPHKLPTSARKLHDKFKAYQQDGYKALIHKNFGNINADKINENGKIWVLSRWADQVNRCANYAQLLMEYNHQAKNNKWSPLKSEETLRNYLENGMIKHLWFGLRYGELKSKEKFSYANKTVLPLMRDALWYSDGTKMNLYYLDEEGKQKTCNVYEVMDAYSECFLGFHVSKSEDYEAQFMAYKMAIQVSGHKPYEIKFDNQGGHGKLQTGNYLNKIARLSVKTKPYNGKSKTIESAFGRMQAQVMAKKWFFTGQNITAKSEKSRANMEMIMANTKNLPTLDEAIKAYKECRDEWNNAIHHKTGIPRNEMYRNSVNPETPEIGMLEMVELFWIERPKPIMVTNSGIEFTEKKVRYSYVVYGDDGLPDTKWLRQNIDNKFIIKFDPEDMSSIYLYKKDALGLRFITEARTKVEVQRAAQFQTPEGLSYVRQMQQKENKDRLDVHEYMDVLQESQGRKPEQHGLNTPRVMGLQTKKGKSKTQSKQSEIGKYMKAVSNAVADDEDFDANELYNML
jgi:hypothetical protein